MYLSNNEKNNNIDYRLFTGNIDEIIPDECIKEYYMKGCFGTDEFFFHNVYYDIGMGLGVIGVAKMQRSLLASDFRNMTIILTEKCVIRLSKTAEIVKMAG